MRRTTPVRIGELWEEFLSTSPGVAKRLAEARVAEVWPKVVGQAVAAHTSSLSVENGVLTARFSSSVVRSEIFMRRDSLRDAINREIGSKVVRVVIVK